MVSKNAPKKEEMDSYALLGRGPGVIQQNPTQLALREFLTQRKHPPSMSRASHPLWTPFSSLAWEIMSKWMRDGSSWRTIIHTFIGENARTIVHFFQSGDCRPKGTHHDDFVDIRGVCLANNIHCDVYGDLQNDAFF